MLTLLFAWMEKATTQRRVKDIWFNALGEILLFDAPMIVILIIMWSSAAK